ncbi:MAG: ribokinase [Candidatus Obscuribacterales bacterium]|nr:ribokinase [Candidatus Obscuribacterales bacterium]
MSDVVVIGSLSLDMVFCVPYRPARGETIKATSYETFVGGKGNNQALAAAKAGAKTAMIGRVGNDQHADVIVKTLESAGVDASLVSRDPEVGTGLANIYIDPNGDNSIVIATRSNERLSTENIDHARSIIENSKIVVLQLEVPLDTVTYAAMAAKAAMKTVLLNPAPAPAEGKLPTALFKLVDILVPNESEATLMTGIEVSSKESALKAAAILQQAGACQVLITLGGNGVAGLDSSGNEVFVPAFKVEVKDTTAAGDAFVGALSARLSAGDKLEDALRYANAAGGLATTKMGAAASLPFREQIEELFQTCKT